ncbi:Adaptive-response sensory-kinase SasA [subsurface metagenome]
MGNTRYKILLIEDDKVDQKAFKRLVKEEKLPYDCTIAGSVSEAKSILGSGKFDVAIVDYMLGDGTAFDILDSARDIPTIFVTGTGSEEIAIKARRAGAYDYLIKDVERNYLKAVPITIENAVEHKKTEEELQLLSGAIMCTDDSVYITNMENKIIFVNRAFCESYGYKKEDVIGKDSNILWIGKPQSEHTRSVFQIVRSAWEVGFYHKRKDGSVFPVSLSRSIIKDSNGNEIAVVGVARDISERLLVEDELRAKNLELEGRNQLKSEFAIVVCRQLMTLIAEFKNIISDAMRGTLGEISPELHNNLKLADKNIDRVRGIISDFLDISQIDAGKMKLELTELGFRSVVSEVVEALSPLAAEKDIELESFMPDSELVIEADRDKIVHVLTNLVSNAIKTVPPNGHIGVRVKDIGSEIAVEVQDDSPSIESSEIDKIFNRLDQIRGQLRYGKEENLAMGLLIAKELLEAHGGCIWAESEDGQGNNFCFTLPKSGIREEVSTAAKAGERSCEDR